ncbi:uncharacterized protein KRP23_14020 [Phytophthora ramorum]|uniref:uncharacterized protein n=1 Tax=Phytophthora ramorum TaxID=164328 RepID=UPI0030B1F98C|nr:hypothetical protein KRP23_14020 [Phytophthora ramorum]
MPAKKRKSTNQVRREEAEALREQIRALQDQVQELNARAEAAAMTPSDHLQLLWRSLRTKNALQELIHDQKLVLAGAHRLSGAPPTLVSRVETVDNISSTVPTSYCTCQW